MRKTEKEQKNSEDVCVSQIIYVQLIFMKFCLGGCGLSETD